MATERTPEAAERAPVRSLRELARAVHACTACDLHADRTTPVTGDGPTDARLVCVASVPRRHEDLRGVALAGAPGNVLDHALGRAGLDRDEVRVTTVVRCRPTDDRAPTTYEVRTCSRHLLAELSLVAPEVVVSLGSFATAVLLGRAVPIDRVAGYRLDILDGVTLIPTYHPGDAVRGVPQAETALRRDLATARAVLDGRLASGADAMAGLRARAVAGS